MLVGFALFGSGKNPSDSGFLLPETTTCTENSPKKYGSIGKVTRLAGEIHRSGLLTL